LASKKVQLTALSIGAHTFWRSLRVRKEIHDSPPPQNRYGPPILVAGSLSQHHGSIAKRGARGGEIL